MAAVIAIEAADGGAWRFRILDRPAFAKSGAPFLHSAGPDEANLPEAARSALAAIRLPENDTQTDEHRRVCALLNLLELWSMRDLAARDRLLGEKCREFSQYLDAKAQESQANARRQWPMDGIRGPAPEVLGIVADEIAQHLHFFGTPQGLYQGMAAHTAAAVEATLPKGVIEMKQAAHLQLIYPFFEQSLGVPGDACEFGCFRGMLSVKLAWFLKAAGLDKRYFAFDTFHGFEIADPGGGVLDVGSFRDDEFNAYDFLTKWSKVLPLVPVKGDATRTVATLTRPLSFVWLDLDMGVLMEPVLRHIWPLCSPDTVIGIDDVGRPETPTVAPWLDHLLACGAFELVFDSDQVAPNTFIRFVRKKGALPPPAV